jgi:hypothetical protein
MAESDCRQTCLLADQRVDLTDLTLARLNRNGRRCWTLIFVSDLSMFFCHLDEPISSLVDSSQQNSKNLNPLPRFSFANLSTL